MRRLFCLIALVAAFVALAAAPAGAIGLTGGCQAQGASFDADHNQIMAATAPSAEPGTSGDPFLVDYDGTVEYAGTGPLMLNHHWDIKVFGITVKSGGAPNGSQQTATIGIADVSDYFPFEITGVYYVEGAIAGEGGACNGDAFVKLIGSPVGTIPWIVAVGLIVVGVGLGYASFPRAKPSYLPYADEGFPVAPASGAPPAPPVAAPIVDPIAEPLSPQEHAPFGAARADCGPAVDAAATDAPAGSDATRTSARSTFVKRKRHPFRGLLAGLLVGLGVSIMLLIYGKVTTESGWPVLTITGGFVVVGVLVGLFGPTRGRRSASATR